MPKLVSENIGKFYQHYPHSAVVVTSKSKGKENAMAAAWHCALSHTPPLYGVSISPRRLTHRLILESKEFGINFLPLSRAELIAAVGGTKGEEIDKFGTFNIARENPIRTEVPLLEAAQVCYECRLEDYHTYGDHTLFVGQVLAVHYDPQLFTADEVLDLSKVKPALYLGNDYYFSPDSSTLKYVDRQQFRQVAGKR